MKAYAIADLPRDGDGSELLERVATLSRLQVDAIQLRAKHLDDIELLDLARACRTRISPETLYLINGRADIAIAAGADGVHLPADGVPVSVVREISPRLRTGVSCHAFEDVENAFEAGADLTVLGPVFETRSSGKAASISRETLRRASSIGVELYALGGMTLDRLSSLEGTSVSGVAAVTMFMGDEPIERIVAAVHEARS